VATPTRRVLIHAGFGSAVLWLAGASQAQRRKKKSSSPPFPVGSEGEIHVNGDEVRKVPGLGKSRIVTSKSIVLLYYLGVHDYTAGDRARPYNAYVDAIRANDPDGVDVLVEKGDAARLNVGTKVRVVEGNELDPIESVVGIPRDVNGARWVRITEGELKGKVVALPTRNLRPPKANDDPPKEK
jgi:hypothetical protein